MTRRRDMLRAAFDKDQPARDTGSLPQVPDTSMRVPSAAVRAMGLTLGRIEEDAARVDALSDSLARGELVHDLDPEVVEPSFVDDRIDRTADPDFRRLVDSIRVSGQQVPILVRPHPSTSGRYQVAYGHRRLGACLELKQPVKALVRNLNNEELVVAQGKENAERRNLSFIERAVFAAHLEQQGFDRAVIQAALAVHPAEMTRLLSVAKGIPQAVIAAIGPAPRAGRPRWMELAELLRRPKAHEVLQDLVAKTSFRQVGSDTRFDLAIGCLRATRPETNPPILFQDAKGRTVVRAESSALGYRFLVDVNAAPGLDRYLLDKLPELLADFDRR
jgi:ParB family transcriptional regulator, chromosome partitioning protein